MRAHSCLTHVHSMINIFIRIHHRYTLTYTHTHTHMCMCMCMCPCVSVCGCSSGVHVAGLTLHGINSSDVSLYAFRHNRRIEKFAIANFSSYVCNDFMMLFNITVKQKKKHENAISVGEASLRYESNEQRKIGELHSNFIVSINTQSLVDSIQEFRSNESGIA